MAQPHRAQSVSPQPASPTPAAAPGTPGGAPRPTVSHIPDLVFKNWLIHDEGGLMPGQSFAISCTIDNQSWTREYKKLYARIYNQGAIKQGKRVLIGDLGKEETLERTPKIPVEVVVPDVVKTFKDYPYALRIDIYEDETPLVYQEVFLDGRACPAS